MKIETEIKLILTNVNIVDLIEKIERTFSIKKSKLFHQITHQFFENDFTKQEAFPRIRNEENGTNTLTVKAKIKDDNQNYFKRVELETSISDVENVVNMMPYFGFKNKISWEKKRINFYSNNDINDIKFCISLDETPMGYFLEIESTEVEIEKIIKTLDLDGNHRTSKPYLGLWDEYKKANNIDDIDMMFERK